MPRATTAPDLYQRITDQILAALEKGAPPWRQPWSADHAAGAVSRPLRHNQEPYRGINVLALWGAAMERGYAAPIWMTFRQAKELGGHVRKGEKGATVVFASVIEREAEAEGGPEGAERIPFLKAYTVFNVEQIEDLPEAFYAPAREAPLNPENRLPGVERFFASLGVDIRHGGAQAFYSMAEDRIQMPPFERFVDAVSYYATLGHECIHWTRHPQRLDRDFGRKRFGDAGYAREELVAELGSAFLCADLGLTPELRDDHAGYIAGWIKALKDDKRAIFQAAAHAERAVAWLAARQPG